MTVLRALLALLAALALASEHCWAADVAPSAATQSIHQSAPVHTQDDFDLSKAMNASEQQWLAQESSHAAISLQQDMIVNTALLQDGPSAIFTDYLAGVISQFHVLGLSAPPPDKSYSTAEELWRNMNEFANNGLINYMENGVYNGMWNPQKRQHIVNAIKKRIQAKRDIDLLIVVGDWSSKEIAQLKKSVPILALNSTTMGIENEQMQYLGKMLSIYTYLEGSGFDHEELLFFKNTLDFATLGFIYEDSSLGRYIADVKVLKATAEERGFKLHSCKTELIDVDENTRINNFMRCLETMKDDIDAFFMNQGPPLSNAHRKRIFDYLADLDVAVYSQAGDRDVRLGALMSPSQSSLLRLDQRFAFMISRLMMHSMETMTNFASTIPMKIALNMDTAQRIGYRPTPNVIKLIEFMYTEKAKPPVVGEIDVDNPTEPQLK